MRFGNETEDLITDEEKTGAEAQTGAVAAAVIGGGGGRGRSTDKRLRDRLRYSSNDTFFLLGVPDESLFCEN